MSSEREEVNNIAKQAFEVASAASMTAAIILKQGEDERSVATDAIQAQLQGIAALMGAQLSLLHAITQIMLSFAGEAEEVESEDFPLYNEILKDVPIQ